MLEITPNQPSKFRTKNWVEVNDKSRKTYNANSQIKFKTSMLRSSLCDCSDAYILVSATITFPNTAAASNRKNVTTKSCTPFTNGISEINNTQIAKDIDIVMLMYNLIEYSNNVSKTSRSLWYYYRNEPFLNANSAIANFPAVDNNSALFKFKIKIVRGIGDDGTKKAKIRVSLKYLSNSWETIEIPLISCEINVILTWSSGCFILENLLVGQESTFKITNAQHYFPVVLLSTQDNSKLLERSKSGFKRTINWNKYYPKVTAEQQNGYLGILINPRFEAVNRLFVLSFENNCGRTSYIRYHLHQWK